MTSAGGGKRGPKEKYDAAAFLAKAIEFLEWEGGIGPEYTRSSFKAAMQELCLETWDSEPGQTWLKKHLADAVNKYEAVQRR